MRAALASLLLLSSAARAAPVQLQARLAVGPLYDRNPARVPQPIEPSAGASLVASVDGSVANGETQRTTGSADLGLRWFTPASNESQLASRLFLSHAIRTGDWLALVLSGSGQDRQIRDDQRESSTVEGTLGAELGPWSWFSASLYAGARRFVYRAGLDLLTSPRSSAFKGPAGGASLRAELGDHLVSTTWELQRRFYDDGLRSTVSVMGADWSYRGRVLLGAGYQLALARGDPIFDGNRHRFQASVGMPVSLDLVLGMEATYVLGNVRVTTEDEERYSSLGARVTRPLAGPVELEATLRWYHSFQSGAPYDRVIAVLAAVVVLGDGP
jgi:hypothetical protein